MTTDTDTLDDTIQVRVVNVGFPDSSFSGPARVHVKVVSNDRDVPIGLEYGIYVVEAWKEGDLDEGTEGQYGKDIAGQVFKTLGLEGRPAVYVMCGERCIYDNQEQEEQAVWLSPHEALFVFDRLDDDVEKDEPFTDPDQMAMAIRIARKMMPVFAAPDSPGWALPARAILAAMESMHKVTVEQTQDHDDAAK
jgi:hypothetical protein